MRLFISSYCYMKRISSRFFLLLVSAGFVSSLSLSAQQYHDAAAFGLKGNVKECTAFYANGGSECPDPYNFSKLSFTRDGQLEFWTTHPLLKDNRVLLISDIVRSNGMLTSFKYSSTSKYTEESTTYSFIYKGGLLFGFYSIFQKYYNDSLDTSESTSVSAFLFKDSNSFTHKSFSIDQEDINLTSLIKDGLTKGGDFFPSIKSYVDEDWYLSYRGVQRSDTENYTIVERDSHGNCTLLTDSDSGESIMRIITYWDESQEKPQQTSPTSPSTTSKSSTSTSYNSRSSSSSSRSSSGSRYRYSGGRTRSYGKPWFTIGIDGSLDFFVSDAQTQTTYYDPYYGEYYTDYAEGEDKMAYGVGLRARIGRMDQMFNLISGARYMFGDMKGVQVPVLLNWNLLRGDEMNLYIGGGYEFGITDMYKGTGSAMLQFGIGIPHFDFQMYYKPSQTVLGVGLTIYL